MKNITVIGAGTGAGTLTADAAEALEKAEIILGAPRLTGIYKGVKPVYNYCLPREAAEVIASESADEFAVLVSGDVGFYSAASKLSEELSGYSVRFIPGVSTVAAFFAKLKIPWQDAAFVSMHGRKMNIADTVRRSRLTFCLAGNDINGIGTALCAAEFGHIKTHAGENLGARNERICEMTAEELAKAEFQPLTVLLFINEEFNAAAPRGLPDGSFSRLEGIPMTKSEIRAVVASKLNLRPGSVCYDIGAGTGSVTVEMALNAYQGHVYAIERREEAIPLIKRNCAAFHIGNVTAVCGEAPRASEAFPPPDAVFIGGSGGGLDGIISSVLNKSPYARIVITAITPETVSAALEALTKRGLNPEIIQINVARGKPIGNLHMMEAQNPVTILSAGGKV